MKNRNYDEETEYFEKKNAFILLNDTGALFKFAIKITTQTTEFLLSFQPFIKNSFQFSNRAVKKCFEHVSMIINQECL